MKLLLTIVVTFFAGMGAGLGTGFAGMSAAAVISPMLITFLGMDPYMAVGIALSSDVLASAVSAYTYHKNKNLDIKNGLIMMVSVLVFTVVGSYIASLVPPTTMGGLPSRRVRAFSIMKLMGGTTLEKIAPDTSFRSKPYSEKMFIRSMLI